MPRPHMNPCAQPGDTELDCTARASLWFLCVCPSPFRAFTHGETEARRQDVHCRPSRALRDGARPALPVHTRSTPHTGRWPLGATSGTA